MSAVAQHKFKEAPTMKTERHFPIKIDASDTGKTVFETTFTIVPDTDEADKKKPFTYTRGEAAQLLRSWRKSDPRYHTIPFHLRFTAMVIFMLKEYLGELVAESH